MTESMIEDMTIKAAFLYTHGWTVIAYCVTTAIIVVGAFLLFCLLCHKIKTVKDEMKAAHHAAALEYKTLVQRIDNLLAVVYNGAPK